MAADGVTVNVLAPGFTQTAMLPDDPRQLSKTTPTGRVGRPEEAADLAVAILRNGYVNSQVFWHRWGMYPAERGYTRSVQPRATALSSHIRKGIENREADA